MFDNQVHEVMKAFIPCINIEDDAHLVIGDDSIKIVAWHNDRLKSARIFDQLSPDAFAQPWAQCWQE